jgi:hypothetical protein
MDDLLDLMKSVVGGLVEAKLFPEVDIARRGHYDPNPLVKPGGRSRLLVYTTCLFLDGSVVQVHVERRGDRIAFTDGGSALHQLIVHGLEDEGRIRAILAKAAAARSVTVSKDGVIELVVESAAPRETLEAAIVLVANAAVDADRLFILESRG